ncbi:MAG: hypothetical protein LBS26_04330 [Campylobacteraceae bacterium]|jgi:hypothetical protein|nr:hypothetical protein [Campylobacteraceae bacterium]
MKNKLFKVLIVIFLLTICQDISSRIFEHYNGYKYESNIYNFAINIFKNTRVETKNFIIDVPRFYWTVPDNTQNSKELWFTRYLVLKQERSTGALIIILNEFQKTTLDILEKECDIAFIKSAQIINNFKVDVYDCESTADSDLKTRYIFYKDEYFFLNIYLDKLKPHYDKFFENVRLKE